MVASPDPGLSGCATGVAGRAGGSHWDRAAPPQRNRGEGRISDAGFPRYETRPASLFVHLTDRSRLASSGAALPGWSEEYYQARTSLDAIVSGQDLSLRIF